MALVQRVCEMHEIAFIASPQQVTLYVAMCRTCKHNVHMVSIHAMELSIKEGTHYIRVVDTILRGHTYMKRWNTQILKHKYRNTNTKHKDKYKYETQRQTQMQLTQVGEQGSASTWSDQGRCAAGARDFVVKPPRHRRRAARTNCKMYLSLF